MKTGTVFQATDSLGHSYMYEFCGVDLEDSTGCRYTCLRNLTTGELANVEYAWFRRRKIKVVNVGCP